MYLRIKALNYQDCYDAALQASINHPGKYVTISVVFSDAALVIAGRLDPQSPSDANHLPDLCRGYFLNGKFKRFTKAQRIEDQKHGHLSR